MRLLGAIIVVLAATQPPRHRAWTLGVLALQIAAAAALFATVLALGL